MPTPAQHLPAVPEQTSLTLSNRAIKHSIGGQVLYDDQRTLMQLIYQTGPEPVQVGEDEHKQPIMQTFEGHKLGLIYVSKALKVIFEIIGLRKEQEPSAEMFKIINRYVCQHFMHFRVQDVYEAFVMAVDQRFPAKLKHFGQVNLEYFVAVWKAYDKYAYSASAVEQPKLIAQQSERSKYLRHRQEFSEATKAVLRDTYAKFLESGTTGIISLPDHLWYLLNAFDFADVNDELWAATYEQAARRVAADKNRHATNRQVVTVDAVKAEHSRTCQLETFRLLVVEAMQHMKDIGVELSILEMPLARVSYIDPEELKRLWHK